LAQGLEGLGNQLKDSLRPCLDVRGELNQAVPAGRMEDKEEKLG
jgi:hypothetical protein